MTTKQTETFSMRMDKETYDMLQEIKEHKNIDSDSQAVRWLIRRYHKKKIAPDGDMKGHNISINPPSNPENHIKNYMDCFDTHNYRLERKNLDRNCEDCANQCCRTDIRDMNSKIPYCCKCAHDIDDVVNAHNCGDLYEPKGG